MARFLQSLQVYRLSISNSLKLNDSARFAVNSIITNLRALHLMCPAPISHSTTAFPDLHRVDSTPRPLNWPVMPQLPIL